MSKPFLNIFLLNCCMLLPLMLVIMLIWSQFLELKLLVDEILAWEYSAIFFLLTVSPFLPLIMSVICSFLAGSKESWSKLCMVFLVVAIFLEAAIVFSALALKLSQQDQFEFHVRSAALASMRRYYSNEADKKFWNEAHEQMLRSGPPK